MVDRECVTANQEGFFFVKCLPTPLQAQLPGNVKREGLASEKWSFRVFSQKAPLRFISGFLTSCPEDTVSLHFVSSTCSMLVVFSSANLALKSLAICRLQKRKETLIF